MDGNGGRGPQQAQVERFVAAMVRQAHRDADLVIAFLAARGVRSRPDGAASPVSDQHLQSPTASFLLELGAALRLGQWEAAGLCEHLPAALPSFEVAMAGAADRFVASKASRAYEPRLARLVCLVAMMRFAHAGPALLGADVLLRDNAGNSLLDAVADFLWQFRNTMQPNGGDDVGWKS